MGTIVLLIPTDVAVEDPDRAFTAVTHRDDEIRTCPPTPDFPVIV